MKITDFNRVVVKYRGQTVGSLVLNDDCTAFQYKKEWIANGFSISPIKLPLKEGVFRSDKRFFGYLDGAFYDCLPDSWGNRLVDRWLTDNGYDPRYTSLFHRLLLLNNTSLGGLDFEPEFKVESECSNDFDVLLDASRAIEKDEPLNQLSFSQVFRSSGSVGGSRPKAFVQIDGEDWILKFPSNRDPKWQSEMEYDYNIIASSCGINVPPFRLIETKKGVKLFATKRFDRDGEKRIHVISLAGLTETDINYPQLDYLSFLQAVRYLCSEDMDQALRMMIFNIKAKNRDDHSRNVSFYWSEKDRKYRLSPAYDLTYTPYIKEHALGCNWVGEPSDDDIIIVGKKMGFKEEYLKQLISTINKKVAPLAKYWGKYE